MAETRPTQARPIEGKMFLFEQPELLTVEEHGNLGLSPVARPFDFVRHVRAAPLVSLEFSSAQKDYPIVFSDTEVPSPLAMLGVVDDLNLFVDSEGNWQRPHYVPFYFRCHPIGFARAQNDQLAVVIDRAAASVSEKPEEPFFDGGKLSGKMQERVDFCARYSQERQRTQELGTRLKELGLFTGQQVKHRPQGSSEEQSLGTYVAVDAEKLGQLDKDTLQQLHAEGSLSAIYAHVFSLENWNRLLDRRAARARQPQ
jgi:hypothetical protein